ncbi:Chloroplast envelope quinone oxidoreductase homolog [Linum grandiflorum]
MASKALAAAELAHYTLPNLPSFFVQLRPQTPRVSLSKPHFEPSLRNLFSLVGGNNMPENKLMHALRYDRYGGGPAGLKHVEVPVPVAKKGEVLVKVEAVSLNPVDWKMQKGMIRPILPFRFPHIPGSDVAGEVVEVGPGVKKFIPGDKVLGMVNHFSGGGLAEYAVFNQSITVKRPAQVSAAEAAGLPVAALTAHQALTQAAGIKLDGSGPPKNILITAGSGGVGHYAIQLAKLATNVHITATCGARNIKLVKSLGADEVLDYKTPAGVALESPSGRSYDAVIHCATGIPWSRFEANLTEKGKVIDITPSFSAMVISALKLLTCSKKKLVPLLLIPKARNLEFLLELVKEGKVKTLIDSRHPLSRGEEAWAEIMDGHATGKIIVEP